MNYSKQREAMLELLHNTKTHPTANEIYTMMRKKDPKISLGTVYRNLGQLTKAGEVLRIDTEHDSVHYDGCTTPHYHFVCSECNCVMDIEVDEIALDNEIESKYGCKIKGHSLIFYGICAECAAKTNL